MSAGHGTGGAGASGGERGASGAGLVGVLVGGKSSRMGGVPKGTLRVADGRSVAGRLLDEVRAALPGARVVLLGEAAAYAALGLPALPDAPHGVGPVGGLGALCHEAVATGAPWAILLACDLPHLTATLIARLVAHAPEAGVVMPRPGSAWNPVVSRWDPVLTAPAVAAALDGGRRSLLGVAERLTRAELPLAEGEAATLDDWDRPEDVRG